MTMMTRFEVARIVGMRALQLSEGHEPNVVIQDSDLRFDYTYTAAVELYTRTLDMCVARNGATYHVSDMCLPPDLASMLNTRDGRSRPVYSSSVNSADSLSSSYPREVTSKSSFSD